MYQIMKTKYFGRIGLIGLIGLSLSVALPLAAQTNAPAVVTTIGTNNIPPLPASQAGFISTVFGWFSSFDPNMPTFSANRGMLWAGASSIQNGPVNLVNDIGGSYDIYRSTTNTASSIWWVAPEANIRNSGVAGTLVSVQAGLGAGMILYDFRFGLYGTGGYYMTPMDAGQGKMFGEFGLRAVKGIGAHFGTGVAAGFQFPDSRQVYSAFLTANF
jgi:hypothetical protein